MQIFEEYRPQDKGAKVSLLRDLKNALYKKIRLIY